MSRHATHRPGKEGTLSSVIQPTSVTCAQCTRMWATSLATTASVWAATLPLCSGKFVWLVVCLFACLLVCLCRPVGLSVWLSVCLSVCSASVFLSVSFLLCVFLSEHLFVLSCHACPLSVCVSPLAYLSDIPPPPPPPCFTHTGIQTCHTSCTQLCHTSGVQLSQTFGAQLTPQTSISDLRCTTQPDRWCTTHTSDVHLRPQVYNSARPLVQNSHLRRSSQISGVQLSQTFGAQLTPQTFISDLRYTTQTSGVQTDLRCTTQTSDGKSDLRCTPQTSCVQFNLRCATQTSGVHLRHHMCN